MFTDCPERGCCRSRWERARRGVGTELLNSIDLVHVPIRTAIPSRERVATARPQMDSAAQRGSSRSLQQCTPRGVAIPVRAGRLMNVIAPRTNRGRIGKAVRTTYEPGQRGRVPRSPRAARAKTKRGVRCIDPLRVSYERHCRNSHVRCTQGGMQRDSLGAAASTISYPSPYARHMTHESRYRHRCRYRSRYRCRYRFR